MASLQYSQYNAAPTNGVPSLTPDQIVGIYQNWLNRPPTGDELATDSANALKYSAKGIELSIANRSNNPPGTGQAGSVGPVTGNTDFSGGGTPTPQQAIATADAAHAAAGVGPAAISTTGVEYAPQPSGPTGPVGLVSTSTPTSTVQTIAASSPSGGFSGSTLIIFAGMALAAFYLLRKKI